MVSEQLFKPLGRFPEKSVVVDNDTTIRKMVASSAGLGLMIETEAYEAARQKQVVGSNRSTPQITVTTFLYLRH